MSSVVFPRTHLVKRHVIIDVTPNMIVAAPFMKLISGRSNISAGPTFHVITSAVTSAIKTSAINDTNMTENVRFLRNAKRILSIPLRPSSLSLVNVSTTFLKHQRKKRTGSIKNRPHALAKPKNVFFNIP